MRSVQRKEFINDGIDKQFFAEQVDLQTNRPTHKEFFAAHCNIDVATLAGLFSMRNAHVTTPQPALRLCFQRGEQQRKWQNEHHSRSHCTHLLAIAVQLADHSNAPRPPPKQKLDLARAAVVV